MERHKNRDKLHFFYLNKTESSLVTSTKVLNCFSKEVQNVHRTIQFVQPLLAHVISFLSMAHGISMLLHSTSMHVRTLLTSYTIPFQGLVSLSCL